MNSSQVAVSAEAGVKTKDAVGTSGSSKQVQVISSTIICPAAVLRNSITTLPAMLILETVNICSLKSLTRVNVPFETPFTNSSTERRSEFVKPLYSLVVKEPIPLGIGWENMLLFVVIFRNMMAFPSIPELLASPFSFLAET